MCVTTHLKSYPVTSLCQRVKQNTLYYNNNIILPLTTRPQQWAEPNVHLPTFKFLYRHMYMNMHQQSTYHSHLSYIPTIHSTHHLQYTKPQIPPSEWGLGYELLPYNVGFLSFYVYYNNYTTDQKRNCFLSPPSFMQNHSDYSHCICFEARPGKEVTQIMLDKW